jgi:hypothetical protein
MNTQENNKLIAEFMGYEIIYRPNSNGFIEISDTELCDVDDLEYHKSWDWLMPVVERIEQVFQGVAYAEVHLSLYSTIDEVYQAVVEFIKEYNTPKFDREIYNIILVHVARTWERFRVVQNHQEMPLDNIQSAEELPNIAQKILENKVVQEFLINRDGSVWDKFDDGCSDTFIERISREYIIANYFEPRI